MEIECLSEMQRQDHAENPALAPFTRGIDSIAAVQGLPITLTRDLLAGPVEPLPVGSSIRPPPEFGEDLDAAPDSSSSHPDCEAVRMMVPPAFTTAGLCSGCPAEFATP